MATTGEKLVLTDEDKKQAILYVEGTGLYKNRLSKFLQVSRPTLDRLLSEDADFFTQLERADAKFCQSLIERVKERNPSFLLKTKYREEFDENKPTSDPVENINKIFGEINRLFKDTSEEPVPYDTVD